MEAKVNAPNILVVDDEPCVREVCVEYLSMAGYAVDESASGEEALAAVAVHPYDLAACNQFSSLPAL
jgi:CheY-like chemotaxis protein